MTDVEFMLSESEFEEYQNQKKELESKDKRIAELEAKLDSMLKYESSRDMQIITLSRLNEAAEKVIEAYYNTDMIEFGKAIESYNLLKNKK